jgi:hypothetical protein
MFKLKELPATYWDKFIFDPLHFVCQGSLFSNNENPLLPHESYLYLIETYQNGGIAPLANCSWSGIKDAKIRHACHALKFLPAVYAFYMNLYHNKLFADAKTHEALERYMSGSIYSMYLSDSYFLRLILDCAEKIKRLEREFCPYTALHLRQEFSCYMHIYHTCKLSISSAVDKLQQNPFSDAMKLPYLNDAIRWLMSLNVDDMIAATTAGEYQPDPSTPEDNAQTGKSAFIKQ